MYKLLKPFQNGLTVMVNEVQNHIARIGLETVNDLKGDNVKGKNFFLNFFIIIQRFLHYLLSKCYKFTTNIPN